MALYSYIYEYESHPVWSPIMSTRTSVILSFMLFAALTLVLGGYAYHPDSTGVSNPWISRLLGKEVIITFQKDPPEGMEPVIRGDLNSVEKDGVVVKPLGEEWADEIFFTFYHIVSIRPDKKE
jgi:hypothetical protein